MHYTIKKKKAFVIYAWKYHFTHPRNPINNLGSYEYDRTKYYILHQINPFYLILNEADKVNKGDDVSWYIFVALSYLFDIAYSLLHVIDL